MRVRLDLNLDLHLGEIVASHFLMMSAPVIVSPREDCSGCFSKQATLGFSYSPCRHIANRNAALPHTNFKVRIKKS